MKELSYSNYLKLQSLLGSQDPISKINKNGTNTQTKRTNKNFNQQKKFKKKNNKQKQKFQTTKKMKSMMRLCLLLSIKFLNYGLNRLFMNFFQ